METGVATCRSYYPQNTVEGAILFIRCQYEGSEWYRTMGGGPERRLRAGGIDGYAIVCGRELHETSHQYVKLT